MYLFSDNVPITALYIIMSRQTITEIKRGQVGTGLLIENDGYMTIDSPQNAQLKESLTIDAQGNRHIPFPFIVHGLFQRYGAENANGRIYPEHILKREVEKYQDAIKERRSYSELNHPEQSSIDLDRIALNVTELHWEGSNLMGTAEIPISDGFRNYGIVSTCADKAAQWIISGLKIGVSSRGLGSVQQQYGRLIVGDDFELICFDVVSQPSTKNAWISTDAEEIQTYKESKENKDKNVIQEDKFSKFDNWLLL